MKKKEHYSKGPWDIEDRTYDGKRLVRIFSSERNCSLVCEVYSNYIGAGTRTNEDARLIAAAPEMYEMLESISKLSQISGFFDRTENKPLKESIDGILKKVRGGK